MFEYSNDVKYLHNIGDLVIWNKYSKDGRWGDENDMLFQIFGQRCDFVTGEKFYSGVAMVYVNINSPMKVLPIEHMFISEIPEEELKTRELYHKIVGKSN